MKNIEIVKRIQKNLSFNATQREISEILDQYRELLLSEIVEGRGAISGIGSFCIVKRQAHKGYDMHLFKIVTIPEHYAIKFRPAKALKEAVNV